MGIDDRRVQNGKRTLLASRQRVFIVRMKTSRIVDNALMIFEDIKGRNEKAKKREKLSSHSEAHILLMRHLEDVLLHQTVKTDLNYHRVKQTKTPPKHDFCL